MWLRVLSYIVAFYPYPSFGQVSMVLHFSMWMVFFSSRCCCCSTLHLMLVVLVVFFWCYMLNVYQFPSHIYRIDHKITKRFEWTARAMLMRRKKRICYSENWKCICWFEIQDVYMCDWPSDLAKESHATECEYFNEIIYLWVLCRCLDQHMGYHRPKHTVKNIDNTQIAWS